MKKNKRITAIIVCILVIALFALIAVSFGKMSDVISNSPGINSGSSDSSDNSGNSDSTGESEEIINSPFYTSDGYFYSDFEGITASIGDVGKVENGKYILESDSTVYQKIDLRYGGKALTLADYSYIIFSADILVYDGNIKSDGGVTCYFSPEPDVSDPGNANVSWTIKSHEKGEGSKVNCEGLDWMYGYGCDSECRGTTFTGIAPEPCQINASDEVVTISITFVIAVNPDNPEDSVITLFTSDAGGESGYKWITGVENIYSLVVRFKGKITFENMKLRAYSKTGYKFETGDDTLVTKAENFFN